MRRPLTILGWLVVATGGLVAPHLAAPGSPLGPRGPGADPVDGSRPSAEGPRRGIEVLHRPVEPAPDQAPGPAAHEQSRSTDQAAVGTVGITVTVQPAFPVTYLFSLGQSYPNPSSGPTVIPFSVARTVRVEIKIYSILGQEVATLLDDYRDAGRYTVSWGLRDDRGRTVAAGVYVYRMVAGPYVRTHKLVVD